ncbi:eCIS core domain-containing protein [Streptomyces mayteni]
MALRQEHQGEQHAGRSGRPRQRQPAAAPATGETTGAAGLMALQGTAGNAAVAAMIQRSRSPQGDHDRDEQQHGPDGGQERAATRPVQRLTVHDVLRRPGQPMEPTLREEMEQRFGGENFASVRMHTGAEADRSAAELDALAYTSRSHIVLSRKAVGDKKVIAHELEHLRQQRAGSVAGTDHGDGVSVSEPKDEFEQSADAVADRVMRAPLSPAGRGPSGPGGLPGVQRDIQRTAGNQAATAHVHQVQRYETSTNPITPELAPDSGDQLPAFAVNTGSVSLTLDREGAFKVDTNRYVEPKGPVTMSWSGDETIAINSTKGQPKEFYAVPEVVDSANRKLARAGNYVRLAQGGHSVTNSRGERLTVVRPRIATDQDDVVRERFMHLVQHECVEVAEKMVGGSLGHAMFRDAGGQGVAGDIGPRGATGLGPLAAALTSRRPPRTPRQAAEAAQGPRPALEPGEAYGRSQFSGENRDLEQGIGINEYANARVGEALTTHTISAAPRDGVPERFDFARNRVRRREERIWGYHYATVLAESGDGRDQITLENFNRGKMVERLLAEAARVVAEAYVRDNPGSPLMPQSEAEQKADKLLGREARSAMGDLWYFKMYQPGTERSFHSESSQTVLNAMTVVTTSVPRLFFEEDSDRLQPFSLRRLGTVAEGWRQSSAPIVVEGHASGGIIASSGLARRRAEAVARELERRDINSARITIKVRKRSDKDFASVYSAKEPEVYVPGNRQ